MRLAVQEQNIKIINIIMIAQFIRVLKWYYNLVRIMCLCYNYM